MVHLSRGADVTSTSLKSPVLLYKVRGTKPIDYLQN